MTSLTQTGKPVIKVRGLHCKFNKNESLTWTFIFDFTLQMHSACIFGFVNFMPFYLQKSNIYLTSYMWTINFT